MDIIRYHKWNVIDLPEEGWVKDVDPVGGGDDLDVGGGAEPVQLVEQLQHSTLHLPVAGLLGVESLGRGKNKNQDVEKIQR